MKEEEEKEFESQEMYEHYRFVADKGQTPLRVDKFLMNLMSNTSRNKIQNAATAGNILVNDKPAKSNQKIKPDDIVTIVLSFPPRELELIAQDIPLNIVYEDNDVIIVNKEAGMVVHPAHGNYDGTMLNALLYHFDKNNEPDKPYLVHRIDKNTSALQGIRAFWICHIGRMSVRDRAYTPDKSTYETHWPSFI